MSTLHIMSTTYLRTNYDTYLDMFYIVYLLGYGRLLWRSEDSMQKPGLSCHVLGSEDLGWSGLAARAFTP